MKFIKSDLLTLLVSLFILASCKNPTGVGLDVGPEALQTKLVDTSTVIAKLQKQDSILTNFTQNSVLGYLKDPVFGETTAGIALGLTMPTSNYKFGTNPVLDSAVLVIPYANFYGDSLNSTFTAEVRQLNEVLYNEAGKSYYSTKTWAKNSAVLGSKTLSTNFKDSITIQDIRKGKVDSVKRVPRQLRIKLDGNNNAFVKSIINLDSVNKVSNVTFNNYIKGLFISVNKAATTGKGGLFSLDAYTNGAARLDVFYKTTSTANVIDTLVNSFPINGAHGDVANELIWNLDGTAVKTELASTAKNSNVLYLKGLGGTFVKVDFPYLAKLKQLGTNITINRAELVFYTDNMPANTTLNPITRLRTYRWDIANRPQLVPDESPNDPRYLGPGFIGGYYVAATKSYVFNFTGYVQDLISGKLKNYGTFINPSDFSAATGLSTLGRSIVGGGSNVTYKVKLRILYTDQK